LRLRSPDLDVLPETDPVVDLLHGSAWRFVRPGSALALRASIAQIIELHSVRALEIAPGLGGEPQQVHAHRFSGKVPVASDLQCPIAFSNDPTAPNCLHGKYSFIRLYIAFMRAAQK